MSEDTLTDTVSNQRDREGADVANAPDRGEGGASDADLEIITSGLTDVGLKRLANQDALNEFSDPERGLRLLVVADGMGGHSGGEVASRMTVDAIGEVFEESTAPPPQLLRDAIKEANSAFIRRAGETRT